MNTKLTRKNRGFTIIEVMIVLAIAGLILAIIFLAVPALQRTARNNSRKNDATHLTGLISEFAGNHAGSLPHCYGTANCTDGSAGLDITNEHWAIMNTPANANILCASGCGGVPAGTGTYPADNVTLDVNEGYTCDPSNPSTLTAGSSHSFAVTYLLETSSSTQKTCIPGS